MLILTRRIGESVMIGDDIVVTVVDIRGDSIRLGIDAPRSVDVHREEVHRELKEANLAAASPDRGAVDALTRQLSARGSTPAPEAADSGSGAENQTDPAPPPTPARSVPIAKPGPPRRPGL